MIEFLKKLFRAKYGIYQFGGEFDVYRKEWYQCDYHFSLISFTDFVHASHWVEEQKDYDGGEIKNFDLVDIWIPG